MNVSSGAFPRLLGLDKVSRDPSSINQYRASILAHQRCNDKVSLTETSIHVCERRLLFCIFFSIYTVLIKSPLDIIVLPEDCSTFHLGCGPMTALMRPWHQEVDPSVLPALPSHGNTSPRSIFFATSSCHNQRSAALAPEKDRAVAVPPALVSRNTAAFANNPNKMYQQ